MAMQKEPDLTSFYKDTPKLQLLLELLQGFPGGPSGKEPTCQYRRSKRCRLIPGFGRSPGEGNDNPLQYSCLGNPMDRGAWQATVHGVAKSWTIRSD